MITLEAFLTVLAGSEDMNGNNQWTAGFGLGSFSPAYDFGFANLFTKFSGQTISVGNSLVFTFGTFSPNPGPVSPGMLSTAFSDMAFLYQNGAIVEVNSANLFTASVGMQPVPEPSTLLLFASGIAGLGAWRYRKFSQAS